jgi:hypothetical protein
MAYNPITSAEIQVKQPVRQELMQKVKDNFDYFYGLAGDTYGNVYNGSFEIDSDNDGVPDGWTRQLYPNGTGGYETANPAHGAKAYKFTHPGGDGNGGGKLISDYIAISEKLHLSESLGFFHWATNNLMRNQVILQFYDKAKVWISDTVIYDNQDNPTSAKFIIVVLTSTDVPVNARYVKVNLVGGESSVNQAGTAYFDSVVLNPVHIQPILVGSAGNVWRADFSIAEGYTSSTSYVDAEYAYVTPNNNILPIVRAYSIQIIFNAEIHVDGSHWGYQRFRIGTSYSNEVGGWLSSYAVTGPFTISIPASTQTWKIVQQLRGTGGYVTYGRKQTDTVARVSSVII